jgi:hypothetical protein
MIDMAGYALVLGLGWLAGACSIAAVIVALVGLRRGFTTRRFAWVFGWLFAPWVLGIVVGGFEVIRAQTVMFISYQWSSRLPLWLWAAVTSCLIFVFVVKVLNGNVASSTSTHMRR